MSAPVSGTITQAGAQNGVSISFDNPAAGAGRSWAHGMRTSLSRDGSTTAKSTQCPRPEGDSRDPARS